MISSNHFVSLQFETLDLQKSDSNVLQQELNIWKRKFEEIEQEPEVTQEMVFWQHINLLLTSVDYDI